MNDHIPQRLRWWFWLILFTPTILSPFIPEIVSGWAPPNVRYPHTWILGASFYVFIALGLSAAIPASIIYHRVRGGLTVTGVIFGAFIFTLLNAITSYGGCVMIGMVTTAFSK